MKKVICVVSMAWLVCMNTPAEIHETDISLWEDFENLSLDMITVEDEFVLESAKAHDNLQIQIVDEDGTLYYCEIVDVPAGTYVISVAHLPKGIYQMVLTTEEGQTYVVDFAKQ